MRVGVDYYPEQWDRELWEKDADLMQQMGVKVVRLAEFAWSRLEPSEGVYDFEWLDEVIELLTSRGMQIVLCTPTNCPPLWFYEKYPEAVQTGKNGNKIAIGIRGHRCIHNADFLRYAKIIIEKITCRYANNPNVVAWQIDNELEANHCYCKVCIGNFREWMKKKYISLENINKAYGNSMWSGEYSSWEQINPPFGSYPDAWLNPSYMLDFNRYASDSLVEHVKWQAELIRKNCPNVPVTTNTWFCQNMPDFYDEFSHLDFVSYDNYPTTSIPDNKDEIYSHAFHLDMMRGIKQDSFWIMEQLSGGIGSWAPMGRTTYPGMIKGYSLQAFAHGADTVLHFRWRTAIGGAEMHWNGLIDHSNHPGRRLTEFGELCKMAETLSDLAGARIESQVAILYSPEDEYAMRIQPQTNGMYYMEQIMLFHDALTGYGVNVDVIKTEAPLDKYSIVIAPQVYLTNKTLTDNLHSFAANGGTVVLTNRCGVKDEYNKCIMDLLPTVYRDMVGAYVEEYDSIGYESATIKTSWGKSYKCKEWNDILALESAKSIGEYDSEFYKGKAAITANDFGEGKVYYVGTVLEKVFYRDFIKELLAEKELAYISSLPERVEVTTRTSEEEKCIFIFNNDINNKEFYIGDKEYILQPFEMVVERMK